jgi:hypothetical protein
LGGHVVGQTRAFLSAVCHDGRLHLTVALVLRPLGGRDQAIKAGELHQQTHQAHATGADFGAPQVDPEHPTMQESQPWGTVEKGHDGGLFVKTVLRRPPCLQRAAGHIKRLGGLTQGEPLGLQVTIRRTQLSTFDAIPALVALILATWRLLDDCAHRDLLLLKPLSWCT